MKTEFVFRTIRQSEAVQAVEAESICFPPNEACKEAFMVARVAEAADIFLVAEAAETGSIAAYINGLATDEERFRDDFFTDASLNNPGGKNIMIAGVAVLPEYRGQGLASELMRQYVKRERERGRKKLLLTCLEDKVEMYEKMGFRDLGAADSVWGGEAWHEMECVLNR